MKKAKHPQEIKSVAAAEPRSFVWWPWAAAAAALILVYQIYSPALNGPFVLDDRYLPYFSAHPSDRFGDWVGLLRPLLMISYWTNFTMAGYEPFVYHATNVLIHFLSSVMVVLLIARLVEWAGVADRLR